MTISPTCLSILQLSAIKGLGLKTFHHLHRELGSVDNILLAGRDRLNELGLKQSINQAICDLASATRTYTHSFEIEQAIEWASFDRHYLLSIEDSDYPYRLKEIYCPPPVIYVKGCLDAFDQPAVALVGSRNASISGAQNAFSFARDFALAGFCVYSGLALGIDAAAHQGALYANGATCAVLGTGLDVIYPKQHIKLAEEITEKGVLISEMNLGAKPVPANFPRRNRIISGLSQGVLVVEASLKSGSLITASYAVEQNRDVFALPGPIDSPVSKGCHALIKQGARLVETVDDILGEWVHEARKQVSSESVDDNSTSTSSADKFEHLSPDESLVMINIGYSRVSFDVLAHHTNLDVGQLTHLLISLELKGELSSVPGGYQRIKTVHSPA
ncbi:MAG: DNA processing protein [Oleiphilaceae bacterium]|jgi:DNA processing protein